MITEEMVKAGALRLAKRNQASSYEPFMGIARAVLEAALSAQVQDVAEYEYRLVTKEGREYARLNATTDEEAQAINDNNFAGRLKVERRVVPEWEAVAAPAKQESTNAS